MTASYGSAESPSLLEAAAVLAHDLPLALRRFLVQVRLSERFSCCVVSGLAVDDGAIGPTPEHWGSQPDKRSTVEEEMWLVLCASLLGEVFGWATQQDGAVVHDIVPVRGQERTQLGIGSTDPLWWHTEEAFHPLRCDYLGLLCLRNRDRVATTVSSIEGIRLAPNVAEVLFSPRFVIRPDDSHLFEPRTSTASTPEEARLEATARARIDHMNRSPQRVPVLFGHRDSPYMAIDPFYMDLDATDDVGRAALDALAQAIEKRVTEVSLEPGEILFVDNFRAVHGRKSFAARYDGTDRWLKRVNITRDLRKSRAYRATCSARVIY
jgi:Fe(II)/alpha-ketoglutarate-dependent arginine beta-hydroxylase